MIPDKWQRCKTKDEKELLHISFLAFLQGNADYT
jgi:hypothetical protein